MQEFDLMKHGLEQQAMALEYGRNVIPFPTAAKAAELRAQGKVIVHKPAELQRFVDRFDDDTFPDDAA